MRKTNREKGYWSHLNFKGGCKRQFVKLSRSISASIVSLFNYYTCCPKNPIYLVFFSENSLQAELSFLLHSLLTSTGNGSKLTVLNLRGGYLATESSRDTSRVVRAHLATAELLKKNARDTAGPSHSQQTYHGTCVLNSAVPRLNSEHIHPN